MMVDNTDTTRPVSGYRKAYLEGLKNPDPKYTPIMCSSWSYSFNDQEKAIIDKLREWAHDYFRTTYIYSNETEFS